jgi:hypothetical protein
MPLLSGDVSFFMPLRRHPVDAMREAPPPWWCRAAIRSSRPALHRRLGEVDDVTMFPAARATRAQWAAASAVSVADDLRARSMPRTVQGIRIEGAFHRRDIGRRHLHANS